MEWTGEYITDFSKILPGLAASNSNDTAADNEETRFSLLTGSMVKNTTHHRSIRLEVESADSEALVSRNNNTALMESWSPAADFLKKRSYQGLDQRKEEAAAPVVMGLTGIPMNYHREGVKEEEK